MLKFRDDVTPARVFISRLILMKHDMWVEVGDLCTVKVKVNVMVTGPNVVKYGPRQIDKFRQGHRNRMEVFIVTVFGTLSIASRKFFGLSIAVRSRTF